MLLLWVGENSTRYSVAGLSAPPRAGTYAHIPPEETLMFKYLILPFVLALTACTGEKSEDSSKDSAAQAE